MPSPDDLSRLLGELLGKVDLLVGMMNTHRDEQGATNTRLGLLEQRVASLEASKSSGLSYLTLTLALAAVGATIGGWFFK